MNTNFQKAMDDPNVIVGGMGWRADPPKAEDWGLSRSKLNLKAFAALPMSTSGVNKWKDSPVVDQGETSACVGHAVAAAVDFLRRTDDEHWDTTYSRLWAYYVARLYEGPQWVKIDGGAYIRCAMDGIRKAGIAPESCAKWRPDRILKAPTPTAHKQAQRWKLGAHYRCNSLEDILNALAAGKPVVGGFACYASMFTREVAQTGRVPMPSLNGNDWLVGWHAVKFGDYDRATGEVEFKNSWGEGWGNKGYGKLPFGMLQNTNLSDDFWCLTSEA